MSQFVAGLYTALVADPLHPFAAMPLVHRRTVPLLPPPDVDALPKDTEVFYLKETSEIFLDYEWVLSSTSYVPGSDG